MVDFLRRLLVDEQETIGDDPNLGYLREKQRRYHGKVVLTILVLFAAIFFLFAAWSFLVADWIPATVLTLFFLLACASIYWLRRYGFTPLVAGIATFLLLANVLLAFTQPESHFSALIYGCVAPLALVHLVGFRAGLLLSLVTLVPGLLLYANRFFSLDPEYLTLGYANLALGFVMLATFLYIGERNRRFREQLLLRLSRTDALTGLANRLRYNERIGQELTRSDRYGRIFSISMLDVDHFKRVNDTWGHHCGDAALIHVAKTIEACVRESDTVFRIGGEELAILMPETDEAENLEIAERTRSGLAESPFLWREEEIRLTASFGCATYQGQEDTAEGLYRRADQNLYKAKDAGRNLVVGASASAGPGSILPA